MWRRVLARTGTAAGVVLGCCLALTPEAHADNCSALQDCFYTVSSAAQVTAATTVVVAALVLLLPALLRGAARPGQAERTAAEEASEQWTASAGEPAPGQTATPPHVIQSGAAHAQSVLAGQPAVTGTQGHASATMGPAIGASPQGTRAQASTSATVPSLPETPDVPVAPEAIEVLAAGQPGGAAAAETIEATEEDVDAPPARRYTAEALDGMRALAITSQEVEDVIRTGVATPNTAPGEVEYAAHGLRVTLAVVEDMVVRVGHERPESAGL